MAVFRFVCYRRCSDLFVIDFSDMRIGSSGSSSSSSSNACLRQNHSEKKERDGCE